MTRKPSSFVENVVKWVTKSNHPLPKSNTISSMLSPNDIPVPFQMKRQQQDFNFSSMFDQTDDYLDDNKQTKIPLSQKKTELKNSAADKKNVSLVKNSQSKNKISDKNSANNLQVKPKPKNNNITSIEDDDLLHLTNPQNRPSLKINTQIDSDTQTDKNDQTKISGTTKSPEQDFTSSTEKSESDKTNLIRDSSYYEKTSYESVERKIIQVQDEMSGFLEPSLPQKLSHVHQHKTDYPEENIVTINIGRIEVRAENSDKKLPESSSLPRPELSLNDYLKRRNR